MKIAEKLKQPQINPRQLLVYVMIQIINVIQGMIPVMIGEDFNATWFVISFIMNNVGYFCIMALRSVAVGEAELDTNLLSVVGNYVSDALGILKDPKTDNTDKIRLFERMTIWTIRQLDELYTEEFKRFTDYIRDNYIENQGGEKEVVPEVKPSPKIEKQNTVVKIEAIKPIPKIEAPIK